MCLFPLQLLAADYTHAPGEPAHPISMMHNYSSQPELTGVTCVATDDWPQSSDLETSSASGDMEDQTLAGGLDTLRLEWRPFPHAYPCVNDGTSIVVALLRPPPIS